MASKAGRFKIENELENYKSDKKILFIQLLWGIHGFAVCYCGQISVRFFVRSM